MLQLELFQEHDYEHIMRCEVDQLKESTEKVRKSLFARHAELAKKYVELHARMEIIERNICQSGLVK